jgi:hypothetical protein
MPGFSRHRFEWVGKPPIYWTAPAAAFFIYGPAWLSDKLWLPHFVAASPSERRGYAIVVDGAPGYVSPWLGWFYEKGHLIFFGFLATLALIMILKHDQVRKVR